MGFENVGIANFRKQIVTDYENNDSGKKSDESENVSIFGKDSTKNTLTKLGIAAGTIGLGIILKKSGALRKMLPDVLNPLKNQTLNANNQGLRAVLYGKKGNRYYKPGLIHVVTGTKYRNQILEAKNLSESFSEGAIARLSGINSAIPRKYQDAFTDLKYMDGFLEKKGMAKLAEKHLQLRNFKETYIMNPVSAVKRKVYTFFNELKTSIKYAFKKKPVIDVNYVKKLYPEVKIPEGLNEKELKNFFIELMRRDDFTEKEIKAVLSGKSPQFYRFIGDTELKILQNGKSVRSAAEYNVDYIRTDITSDPNYNFNQYRVMFKNRESWNPFAKETSVKAQDSTLRKWWLMGEYSMDDIVCCEKIW